jgi:hypothetical protein
MGLFGIAASAAPATKAVNFAKLPKLKSGVPAYPTPFLAIARTPHPIASPQGGGMGIQSDVGFLSGFSGFVDEATGQFGFPGYRLHSIANFAFDEDKLVIQAHVPDAVGRHIRANTQGDLAQDDTFELLIQPRDNAESKKGQVYRVIGNAVGHWQADLDEPGIGQFHRPWDSGIHYGSMIWDPTGGWMASIAIPWDKLGGKPKDGDIWGVQFAVHYPDPKINAFLSPTDDFTDTARFARIRFDFNRRVNYRCHYLSEEMKTGRFSAQYLLANGGTTPQTVEMTAAIYKAGKETAHGSLEKTCPPGATYWANGGDIVLPSQPATQEDRNTVAHIVVYDKSNHNSVIYDQWVPYWQAKPGERDWITQYFGKEFTFNIGPYPSLGIFDYAVDAQTLHEANPTASKFVCVVLADGKEVKRDEVELPRDGKIARSINLGSFTDGVTYQLHATISDDTGKAISDRTESFTRHVMPFEKAAKAGLSDIVIPPFTPPVIDGTSVSCWGRTYKHGEDGLLESLIAAGQDLLTGPATFKAVLDDGKTVTLTGDKPQLTPHGNGAVDYQQTFRTNGLILQVKGAFDYDGFYKFTTTFGPDQQPVELKELRLEIPIKPAHATLIDAAVTWMIPGWEKALGFLGTEPGRVWDSHTLPYQEGNQRTSNLPPYVWVGDDDRGLCFSAASAQGTHNDPKLPSAALDRSAQAVVMTIWLVNKPLELEKPRTFQFALQASPFKPQPANARLWRDEDRNQNPYKNGLTFANFWNPANYPTYGRWLTLDYLKKCAEKVNCDRIGLEASALSECSGTPEYQQFYYEWGSGMDQFKRFVSPVPADLLTRFKETGLEASPFVMIEAFSDTVKSNRDYRVWWLSEAAKHAGISYVYQDNATWVYTNRPRTEYGYTRDDGGYESTSMIWKSRTLLKRFATAVTEAGQPSQPAVWPNLMSPVLPGRSFCGKALTGEYTNSDQLRMGMLRVHLSKQWGIVTDWLCQQPSNAGAEVGTTRKYWHALFSQLCLLDVTNISRQDTAEVGSRWWNALDLFWLDDPTVQWHPYYNNPTLASVAQPATTFVSTYTAKGRMLAVVSNQDTKNTIETVKFKNLDQYGAPNLRYFYDAISGEEVQVVDGALKLFVAGKDYRVVIGFPEPWKFSARNRLPNPQAIPAQSTLDARVTLGEICRHLLTSRTLPAMPGAHRLTEAWAREILKQLPADSHDVIYLNAKATSDVDLGDPRIQCSVFYDRKRDCMLIGYYNGTDQDRNISTTVRAKLAAKVGKTSFNYIYAPISGESQWSEIDVPAHRGRWEACYPDGRDMSTARHGVYEPGTFLSNIIEAIHARKAEMEH